MYTYIVQRLAFGALTVIGVSIVAFMVVCMLPGDPHLRLMLRHILPQCIAPFLILATAHLGVAIEAALSAFEHSFWGHKYPAIGQSWRRAWSEVIPFYAFPGDVRRILYTTDAIEALNSKLRRAVRARGLPQRRGGNQTPFPGLEPIREGVDHATARVDHGQIPVRCPIRRALYKRLGLNS